VRIAKQLDQPCFAFGKRVPAPLGDHEGEGAHVPCASFKFDECSFARSSRSKPHDNCAGHEILALRLQQTLD
jgi:hypothetical protein